MLTPLLPKREIPVSLEVLQGGNVTARIPFCYLRIVRWGSKEIEIKVAGGRLAGAIGFLDQYEPGGRKEFNFALDLGKLPASQAMATVQLLLAAKPKTIVRIESLDVGRPLIEAELSVPVHELEGLEGAIDYLKWLATINDALGLDLRYPGNGPDPISIEIAELAWAAIQHGVIAQRIGVITLSLPVEKALEMLSLWVDERPISLDAENHLPLLLHGIELPLGPRKLHLEGAIPIGDIAALRAYLGTLPGGSVAELQLACTGVAHLFERWIKPDA